MRVRVCVRASTHAYISKYVYMCVEVHYLWMYVCIYICSFIMLFVNLVHVVLPMQVLTQAGHDTAQCRQTPALQALTVQPDTVAEDFSREEGLRG